MSLFDRVEAFIPRNAIMQAELVYQRRSMQGQRRRWLHWIWRAILIAGITMAMILFWGEFAGALLNRDAGPIGERLQIATDIVIALAVVMHFALMIQTLSLAANSVARERQNNTWDMLVLTGIDARQIVMGKWWATIQRQWRSYAVLAVLRIGASVWAGAESSRTLSSSLANGLYYYGYGTPPIVIMPTFWDVLLAGFAVFALTMLNLGFTAACGVLASTQIRRSVLALGRAISLRLLILLGTVLVVFMGLFLLSSLLNQFFGQFSLPWLGGVISDAMGTLLDNGANLGMSLGSTQFLYFAAINVNPKYELIASGLLSALFYIGLTRFVLKRAQRQAVREQALPPLATAPSKSSKIELTNHTQSTSTGL